MTAKQSKRTRNLRKIKQEIIKGMVDEEGWAWCQKCEKAFAPCYAMEGLELHHKVKRSQEPNHEKADDPANLVLLCASCHRSFHS